MIGSTIRFVCFVIQCFVIGVLIQTEMTTVSTVCDHSMCLYPLNQLKLVRQDVRSSKFMIEQILKLASFWKLQFYVLNMPNRTLPFLSKWNFFFSKCGIFSISVCSLLLSHLFFVITIIWEEFINYNFSFIKFLDNPRNLKVLWAKWNNCGQRRKYYE